MPRRKSKLFAIMLCLCFALCACQTPQGDSPATPTNQPTEAVAPIPKPTATPEPVVEEVSIEKILSEVPDPEIGRAYRLGLVPKEMLCDYDSIATERELVDLIGNAVEKLDMNFLIM